MKNELITFKDGTLELNVPVSWEQETVWITRNQMAELFDRDVKTIGKHINNALKEELDNSTVANFATVQMEGGREVERNIEHYNLDMILPTVVLVSERLNPFNPSTKIKYQLSDRGFVNLRIYDAKGVEICQLVNQFQTSGQYEIFFNATNYGLVSGVYFLKLKVNEIIETKKMLLIK